MCQIIMPNLKRVMVSTFHDQQNSFDLNLSSITIPHTTLSFSDYLLHFKLFLQGKKK